MPRKSNNASEQPRCPHPACIGFGRKDLGGYCTRHNPNREYIVKDGYYGYGFHQGKFVPDEYGIMKDKYGYEEV